MLVVSHSNLYDAFFDHSAFSINTLARNIFLNKDVKQLVSKKYVELLENRILDKNQFQALITELFDQNRIVSIPPNNGSSLEDEYIHLSTTPLTNQPLTLSITLQEDNILEQKVANIFVLSKAKKPNIHWVIKELASKSSCTVNHFDFKTDSEIKFFIDSVIAIPKYIRQAQVFDREVSPKYKDKLKGFHIDYYTLGKGMPIIDLLDKKKEIRRALGGRLKLWYTKKTSIIHERKILFENIIITSDNSFNNIAISDPTWQLNIQYSPDDIAKWLSKCIDFIECK